VTRTTWKWSLGRALPLLVFFLSFDIPFFVANAAKFFHGGYVPVVIGTAFFTVMVVWRRGRRMLSDALAERIKPIDEFLAKYGKDISRIKGTGVVMASQSEGIPPVVVHHVERLHVLNETVVLLTIVIARVPYISPSERVAVESLNGGFHRVIGTYGFMEHPDVPQLMRDAKSAGLEADIEDVTYFLGRETILAGPGGKMGEIEESIFAILSRNSRPATAYFRLPPDQVIEIGTQIDL